MNEPSQEIWQRLRKLLDRALDLSGEERRRFVDSLEGEDSALRDELARLIDQHEHLAQKPAANAMDLIVPVIGESLKAEAALDDERVGESIGPYRLVQLLGAGGMGAVYLAERETKGFAQCVALKLVRQALGSAAARERFERERQILAGLKHPGIASLFDGGETAHGHAFYTMEFVEGETVTDYCRKHRLTVAASVRLLLQVAAALAYAHQNLIVHRDIKPSNVLVTAEGRAKLVDFGLAKVLASSTEATMTQAGIGPMTPAYASPEQFRNDAITVATDIYQFGVLCFVVLTGRLPYRADPNDSLEWARAVTEQEPMTLARAAETAGNEGDEPTPAWRTRQLTRDLDAIVRKALAKRPDDRYRSMDAMIADLEAYLDNRPVSARRAGPIYFASRFAWRWRYAVAATVLAFVALGVTTFSAVRQAHVAEREAERANSVADFLASLFKQSDPSVNNGDKLTANQILDRGAERIEKDMASQPEQLGRLLTVIGGVYSSMGNLARAETSLERAATILESTPNRDDYDLGHAWVRLAWVRNNQHRGREAIEVLDRAIPLLDPASPRARAELIAAHTFSALAHHDLAEPSEERREFEAAIALIEQTSEPTASMAGIYSNFSTFLRDQGDLSGSRSMLEKAVALNVRTIGEDRFPTMFAKGNLVLTMIEERDYDAARPLMERTAQQLQKVFGEKSLQYGRAQRVLGVIAGKQHRFDEAEAYFAQAETIYATAPEANPADASAPIQSAAEMELDRSQFDALAE